MSAERRAKTSSDVLVLGAGPAGLTAAYELCRAGIRTTVVEKDDLVGGLSRTMSFDGYTFDLGGHRFFTRIERVERFWREILGADLLTRQRLSRILYRDRLFAYPLRPMGVLFGLPPWTSLSILASYVGARLWPAADETNLEDWVSNRFGRKLYRMFFQTYTEKVWGMPCQQINADWAAQRIQGLSLTAAIINAFWPGGNERAAVKTLTDSFLYPKLGPGMMWEEVARRVQAEGAGLRLGSSVQAVHLDGARVDAVVIGHDGAQERLPADQVISSMPLGELIEKTVPRPDAAVVRAARALRHRDFLIVFLIVDAPELFRDQWIYVHDPRVKLGRIQNFKNWSPYMCPDAARTSLGLEYFCDRGDALWSASDEELIEHGQRELDELGLLRGACVLDGTVVRMPNAYPVYDAAYGHNLQVIRGYVDGITNLQVVGRNGTHRYNNQDHSMLTAMLAVDNLGGAEHDLWAVNADNDPGRPATPAVQQELVRRSFARMDAAAFGAAVGCALGLVVLVATLVLVIKGGEVVGPNLEMLSQFFRGYRVTWTGAWIGAAWGWVTGFVLGWLMARWRNFFLAALVFRARRRAEALTLRDLLGGF